MRLVGTLAADRVARVASAARLGSLDEVLRWGAEIVDVVVQDEYTHDVIATRDGVVLVFDTT